MRTVQNFVAQLFDTSDLAHFASAAVEQFFDLKSFHEFRDLGAFSVRVSSSTERLVSDSVCSSTESLLVYFSSLSAEPERCNLLLPPKFDTPFSIIIKVC